MQRRPATLTVGAADDDDLRERKSSNGKREDSEVVCKQTHHPTNGEDTVAVGSYKDDQVPRRSSLPMTGENRCRTSPPEIPPISSPSLSPRSDRDPLLGSRRVANYGAHTRLLHRQRPLLGGPTVRRLGTFGLLG